MVSLSHCYGAVVRQNVLITEGCGRAKLLTLMVTRKQRVTEEEAWDRIPSQIQAKRPTSSNSTFHSFYHLPIVHSIVNPLMD
jgi:hypothetical protein